MCDCECAHARKTRTSSVFARLTVHVTAIWVCAPCALVKRAAGGKRQRPHSPFGGKRREASASSCHSKSGKFQITHKMDTVAPPAFGVGLLYHCIFV